MKPEFLQRLMGLFLALLFCAAALAEDIVWIDVRTATEFNDGHVAGAVNIPFDEIESGIAPLGLQSDQPIYVYCGSGRRAGLAKESLQSLGYTEVVNVGGLDQALELAGEPEVR